MASLAPLRPKANSRIVTGENELTGALRAWRRRLSLQKSLRWAENGGIVGMLLACLLLLISRFTPWSSVLLWAAVLSILPLLCALGLALYYRPSFARSARQVDGLLAFHDRLATAWDYRAGSAPLLVLQRRDALRRLSGYTPAASITLHPGLARLATLASIVLALVLLLVMPNPENAVLQQQAAFQNSLARQVASLSRVRRLIDSQATTPAQLREQIDKILRQLTSQLQQANNQSQVQQILAQGQQELNKLRDPQSANKSSATTAAGSALQNSSNANLQAAGKALSAGNSKGLSNALRNLASQVNSMTSAQRAQLAQQVERAANQAAGNPQLASALHQFAKAIAAGNASDITSAVQSVEDAAAQQSANGSSSSSIEQASQTLQKIANAFASSTDNGSNSNANLGSDFQTRNGSGSGQGQSPGQGNQGNGGQSNTGNKAGKNQQVFVPGQVGSGTSTTTSNGDSGTVQHGSNVPYSQVIAQYVQMAHDAIDNSNIPSDLKNIISGYYDALEGQK
jgi:hypothetical protein